MKGTKLITTDKQTYVQIPRVLQDFVPFGAAAQKLTRAGVPMTMYCLWATGSCLIFVTGDETYNYVFF